MDSLSIIKSWKNWLGGDMDRDKALVDTVNALITVAAFIAGVQAQVISFTLPLERDFLGRMTNFFAVVGLILDISGTFLGVIHAIILQQRIRIKSNLQTAITDFEETAVEVQHQNHATHDMFLSPGNEGRMQELLTLLETHLDRPQRHPGAKALMPSPTSWTGYLYVFGFIPLLAMGGGVVFLVLVVLLFSAKVFGHEVIIGSMVALSAVITLSFLPFKYALHKVHSRG